MYRTLFVTISKILKSIEGGFVYQTDGSRAFLSSVIISVLFQINIIAWVPHISMDQKLTVFAVNLGVNFFIICVLGEYKTFVKKVTRADLVYKAVSYVFIVGTLVYWFIFQGFPISGAPKNP